MSSKVISGGGEEGALRDAVGLLEKGEEKVLRPNEVALRPERLEGGRPWGRVPSPTE